MSPAESVTRQGRWAEIGDRARPSERRASARGGSGSGWRAQDRSRLLALATEKMRTVENIKGVGLKPRRSHEPADR